jgi:hypothetical protein
LKEPNREEYGLSVSRVRQLNETFGYIKSEVEKWNLSKFSLDDMKQNDLKETIWELIYNVSNIKIGWDNWPQIYEAGVINQLESHLDLKAEVVSLLNKEREYKKAKEQYNSWLNWKKIGIMKDIN